MLLQLSPNRQLPDPHPGRRKNRTGPKLRTPNEIEDTHHIINRFFMTVREIKTRKL
jgi:hypothetical protein